MAEYPLLIAVVLAALLLLNVWGRRRTIDGQKFRLFRPLFPSWRFFEETCEVPLLYRRISTDGAAFGPWEQCLSEPRRSLASAILNPQGNLYLAYGSLLQQLLSEAAEVPDGKSAMFADSVAYKLTKSLIEQELRRGGLDVAGLSYQFKVRTAHQAALDRPEEDALISMTHAYPAGAE